MTRGRRVAAVLALVGALLGTAATAHAAQLDVAETVLTTQSSTRCAEGLRVGPGAIAADGSAREVVVTGLTAVCAGALIEITVADASGPIAQFNGVVPASGSSAVTVVGPRFTPASRQIAAATVGTWGVPAVWAYVGPPQVAASCQVRESGNGAAVPGVTCRLGTPALTWGSTYWQHLQVSLPVELSASLRPSQYVSFTFPIPTEGTPAWWAWPGADIASISFGAGAGGVTSRCSELPVVSGRTPNNYGGVGSLFLDLTSTGSSGVCQPG